MKSLHSLISIPKLVELHTTISHKKTAITSELDVIRDGKYISASG